MGDRGGRRPGLRLRPVPRRPAPAQGAPSAGRGPPSGPARRRRASDVPPAARRSRMRWRGRGRCPIRRPLHVGASGIALRLRDAGPVIGDRQMQPVLRARPTARPCCAHDVPRSRQARPSPRQGPPRRAPPTSPAGYQAASPAAPVGRAPQNRDQAFGDLGRIGACIRDPGRAARRWPVRDRPCGAWRGRFPRSRRPARGTGPAQASGLSHQGLQRRLQPVCKIGGAGSGALGLGVPRGQQIVDFRRHRAQLDGPVSAHALGPPLCAGRRCVRRGSARGGARPTIAPSPPRSARRPVRQGRGQGRP
jgi:hypothetical protein